MKTLLFSIFIVAPLLCFSQGMKIKWEDSSGREFSINTHTRSFQYSMVAGDKIYYNSAYSGGPEGSVKSVGNVKIYYNSAYSGGPEGSVKSVGNVKIYYNSAYSGGPEGTVKSVGGLKVYYNSAYSGGPEGSIKSTSGSVN
mgnify:FL=1